MSDLGPVSRRAFVAQLLAGVAIGCASGVPTRVWAAPGKSVALSDGVLSIEFDSAMRSRLGFRGAWVTGMTAAEALYPIDGNPLEGFVLLDQDEAPIAGPHGPGRRHRLRGLANGAIERVQTVTFFDRYPGMALVDVVYRNVTKRPVGIAGWRNATYDLLRSDEGMWTFAGASYPNRRDWVQPVSPGFEQRNFMGMNGSDYGGGTPMAVVWRRDVGIAVGHVELEPRLVSLPVAAQPAGTRIGLSDSQPVELAPGETLATPATFLMVHSGDYFAPLDTYRRIMAERGMEAPRIPEASYGPIWCAWGYERNFTPEQVYGTLPKAKELGFEWAVLDDGWQNNVGDWKPDQKKFPRGDADMRAFTDRIRADGMLPRLWLAPLAVAPGSDLLRDHPDMLLLGREGGAENISWWNAFTLCPAYPPTVDYFRKLIRQSFRDWGYAGLKLDGQHLNGVAPCYNPAHRHERPEESYEKLQDFWKALYEEAVLHDPDAVIEICPCGDSFAFYNVPAMNNTPASDPESSWQVRLKGKSFKAMMGPSAPFSGDHVELSDGGDDFASTYGIGGIPSTKFTWPRDTSNPTDKLPAGGFVLTPQKEAVWRRWIDLYRSNRLAEGIYRGELYDIGFDKPEAHVVEKGGALHYAFYADHWDGPIVLRGLGAGSYALTDTISGAALGTATASANRISASFDKFLLVRAQPIGQAA